MKLVEKFMQLNSRVVSALLPPICLLCGYATHRPLCLCLACEQDLPILSHHCQQCAQFLHGVTEDTYRCGSCLTDPPLFERTFALLPYEQPVIHLITQLKFHHQLSHARLFGELLASTIRDKWYKNQDLPDLIIPVPLHQLRLRERGFNQALEIARPLQKSLRIPIDAHGIERARHTAAQSRLSANARKSNIRDAFTPIHDYSGRHVALIDDVITTGHTIRECSRVIHAAGARRIDVWCCARRG